MKKMISMLLVTAMLCGATNAYDISDGQMLATPDTVQSDLWSLFSTLGLGQPRVTGLNDASITAAMGDQITIHVAGSSSTTRTIAARLDTTDVTAALRQSQDFGAVCGSIMSLVSPEVSLAIANNALLLESVTPTAGVDSLRAYYFDQALFTYEVAANSVRFTALAYPEQATGIQLLVNDSFLALDVQPKIVEGRTLVPVRGIFEQLGAAVEWDAKTQTATMTRGETVVRVTIGSKTATVNGESRLLDVPAQLSQPTGAARTLVPIRFISEALGASVGWNNQPQTVLIAVR